MKLNVSYPVTGCQKTFVVDDDKKLLQFFGKRMGQEVSGDDLGDEFKGYVFKITGGNDKDGFSMKQGILIAGRTRILMSDGHSCYRVRRTGERKRKSVRGCIVGHDLSVLALSVAKVGEKPIEGLTTDKKPRRKGPKRATRIRKLFNLQKTDDPRRFVLLYSRKIEKNGKVHYKTPKIQRLVTDIRLRRKKLYRTEKKARWVAGKKASSEYIKLLQDLRKKRLHASTGANKKEEKVDTKTAAPTKAVAGKTATTKKDDKKPVAGKPVAGKPVAGKTTAAPTKPADTKKVADTKKPEPKKVADTKAAAPKKTGK
jgi:small subunit ribosomal protein S6e